MKKLFTALGAVCAALFLCPKIYAVAGGEIAVDTYLAVPAAYASTASMRTDGMNWASAQVTVTSVTQASQTFGDGQASTGTFTVVSYTALSTAAASGQYTMVSTQAAVGVQGSASVAIITNTTGTVIAITGPPGGPLNVFTLGGNWSANGTTTNVASSLATLVQASSNTTGVTATASNSIVTISCLGFGTFCNSYAVTSTSPTAISTAAFTLGANPVTITVGGATFTAGNQFLVGANTTAMATNLAAAISADIPLIATATASGAVVYATATIAGTIGNTYPMATSNALAISTSALFMSGGQNNATITVNGTVLTANAQWYPQTSNAITAGNIETAITNSSVTTGVVGGTASAGAVAYASSTVIGANTNYTLAASTNAITVAVLVSSSATTGAQVGVMAGGLNSGYAFNGVSINLPSNTFLPGEAVTFSTGSGVTIQYSTGPIGSGASVSPLAFGATYYIVDLTPPGISPNVGLATTQANAVAGTALFLVSSVTKTTQDLFTLNLSSGGAISGTPSGTWMVSNDNTNWMPIITTPFNITLPSVAGYTTFLATGAVTNFDFGHMDYGWLGYRYIPPTTGIVNTAIKVIGKQQ